MIRYNFDDGFQNQTYFVDQIWMAWNPNCWRPNRLSLLNGNK